MGACNPGHVRASIRGMPGSRPTRSTRTEGAFDMPGGEAGKTDKTSHVLFMESLEARCGLDGTESLCLPCLRGHLRLA